MRTFNIYQHSSLGEQSVKVGFSWPCLFFGVIWAMFKGLWAFVGLILLVTLLMFALELMMASVLSPAEMLPVSLVINLGFMVAWIAIASKGNEMRESNLRKRGYSLVATLQAATPEAALAKVKNEGLMPVLRERLELTV